MEHTSMQKKAQEVDLEQLGYIVSWNSSFRPVLFHEKTNF